MALEQSDKLFPYPAHALAESPDPTAALLTAEAQRLKGHLAAGLVTVQGQSEAPLTLGAVVSINGKGLGGDHSDADSFGTYRLTALTHFVNHGGTYRSAFTAIPHLLDMPPLAPTTARRPAPPSPPRSSTPTTRKTWAASGCATPGR